MCRSPSKQWKIIKELQKELEGLKKQDLDYSINALYSAKLISQKWNKDGTATMILTDAGKKISLTYDMEKMKVKSHNRWDGEWRIVTFDFPERLKKVRDSFRFQIRRMGLIEFQKSVFVHPFDCRNEIDFVIEFYNARKYVRYIVARSIDNELDLKRRFGLL